MKDQELIPALKEGGEARKNALSYIFKHRVIRNSILKKLQPYQARLRNHFPRTEAQALGRKSIPQESYQNYFFIEAIVELEKKIRTDTFRGQSFGELHNFLVSTALFKCIGWLRKRKPTEPIVFDNNEDEHATDKQTPLASTNLEEEHINRARKEKLLELLKTLGKSCQSILLLDAYGYSNAEIARKLNHTKDSVKSLKSACRRKLEELIREDDELLDLYDGFLKKR